MRETLKKAQDKYGFKNQIGVTIEELCELSAVLSKYARYPDHDIAMEKIREKVIEEFADVEICLNHVLMIFDIDPREITRVRKAKIQRMKRWLESEEGFHQTTKDRDW